MESNNQKLMKENSYSSFLNNSKSLSFQNNQRIFGRELTNMNIGEQVDDISTKQLQQVKSTKSQSNSNIKQFMNIEPSSVTNNSSIQQQQFCSQNNLLNNNSHQHTFMSQPSSMPQNFSQVPHQSLPHSQQVQSNLYKKTRSKNSLMNVEQMSNFNGITSSISSSNIPSEPQIFSQPHHHSRSITTLTHSSQICGEMSSNLSIGISAVPSINKSVSDISSQNFTNKFNNMDSMAIEEDSEQFDIDANSKNVVSQYTQNIFDYLKANESQFTAKSGYMSDLQTDINEQMRAILIDWLVDVHIKFKLLPETLFFTVNLIDRYLEKQIVTRNQLQLVGVCAMFISCKYEEIYAPELKDFVYVCDQAYTLEEILDMEGKMLLTMDFNLTFTSSLRFMERYSALLKSDERTFMLARYLLELAMIQYKMLQYSQSNLAASAIYLANKITGKTCWNDNIHKQSKFVEADVRPCAKDLLILLKNTDKSSLQALKRQFSVSQFYQVSKIEFESQN